MVALLPSFSSRYKESEAKMATSTPPPTALRGCCPGGGVHAGLSRSVAGTRVEGWHPDIQELIVDHLVLDLHLVLQHGADQTDVGLPAGGQHRLVVTVDRAGGSAADEHRPPNFRVEGRPDALRHLLYSHSPSYIWAPGWGGSNSCLGLYHLINCQPVTNQIPVGMLGTRVSQMESTNLDSSQPL